MIYFRIGFSHCKWKINYRCHAPLGGTKTHFSLVKDGPGTRTARIKYSWPPIAVDIKQIFAYEIKSKKRPTCHPKIEALKEDLEINRLCIEDFPKGSMKLTLPILVQTMASTIYKTGKRKADGMLILIFELMAYQTTYTVKEKDKIVVFKNM